MEYRDFVEQVKEQKIDIINIIDMMIKNIM